jgi:hypothetical protein
MYYRKMLTYSGIVTVPVYFVLDSINQFWGMIPTLAGAKVLIICIPVAITACFFLGKRIQVEKVVLFLIWSMLNYFFFKVLKDYLIVFTGAGFLRSYKVYLPLLMANTLCISYLLLQLNPGKAVRLNTYLNSLFLILFFVEVGKSTYHLFYTKPTPFKTERIELKQLSSKPHPSIYLFVVDEYAGINTMAANYGFANHIFTSQLKKKSFFIPAQPNSNYNGTPFSVLSMLNMSYIENVNENYIKSVADYSKCTDGIKTNQLMDFFGKNGYQLVNNSFFSINNTAREKYLFLPVEDRLMLDKTFGAVLFNDLLCSVNSNKFHKIINDFPARIDKYNQTIIQKSLNIIQNESKQIFMYSHLMMPHQPFLRDQFGKLRSIGKAYSESNSQMNITAYINYMHYCNTVILNMVDAVMQKEANAIIIIVSDHGLRNTKNGDLTNNSEFNNFMAIRTPANRYSGFTDSVCLVNLFRLVLNNHFEQSIELLPNRKINVKADNLKK